jgi:O-antigen/teichoic acid export membrane protein
VSAFALQHRSGAALKDDFRHATAMITGIAWPFFIFLGLLASPITHILFGNGWDAAIPIARILCIAACISALSYLNAYAFQAMGAVNNTLVIQFIAQPLKIALLMIAALGNLTTVAGALIVSSVITVVVSYRHAHQLVGTSLMDVVRACLASMGVALCAAIVPVLVVLLIRTDDEHVWLPMAIGSLGAFSGWLIGLRLFRHPLWPEIPRMMATTRRGWRSLRADVPPAPG